MCLISGRTVLRFMTVPRVGGIVSRATYTKRVPFSRREVSLDSVPNNNAWARNYD